LLRADWLAARRKQNGCDSLQEAARRPADFWSCIACIAAPEGLITGLVDRAAAQLFIPASSSAERHGAVPSSVRGPITPRCTVSMHTAPCHRALLGPRVAPGSRQDPPMATPGNFGGGSTGPDRIFLGIRHNEGATKCAGARARPEPCAAKPEPPDHKARGSHESGSRSQVSYGWTGQQSSSGFFDIARPTLGVFASSDRF
jgi:hypothetical protein